MTKKICEKMQSPKAILYLLTFRTPQNTVLMEERHNVVFQLPNSLENASCTKAPYFRVIQYIRVFRLHGLKKISKLSVNKPTKSNSIYKLHDCIKHRFHIQ
ncbi:hypothetical protein AVEN_99464-1 [Araneus ventricosus]|uniref:Uncharacterized protein n=1 Tax=Araneus ventricosus TaxID=182803 RepID=A0A4Y2X7T2_ARAVE|nr:hypothetical protein AVEN_99464-1 [Araneus ventricosus]